MTWAIVCTALLGLLLFGLSTAVSLIRLGTRRGFGTPEDPADLLTKLARAQGNAAEYVPMMGLLMLIAGRDGAQPWEQAVFVAAVAARYAHAAGMLAGRTLRRTNRLRFYGAAGTYLSGVALVVAALLAAL